MTSLFSSPAKLHRLTSILTGVTAALGGILLAGCWAPLTHGIFAALLGVVLLNTFVSKSATAGIVSRVLIGIFWVWAALMVVETADTLYHGMSEAHVATLQNGLVWFGGLFLCYLTPAGAVAMLYHGSRTVGYDRVMGCVLGAAQVVVVVVAVCTEAGITWPLDDGLLLPYVWLAMTVFTAVMLIAGACARTAEQQAALDSRRASRMARRAAHKTK